MIPKERSDEAPGPAKTAPWSNCLLVLLGANQILGSTSWGPPKASANDVNSAAAVKLEGSITLPEMLR
jgi:hypothetical protein